MNELVIADINAHMGNTTAAGVEKHQISGLQIAFAYIGADLILLGSDTGKGDFVSVKDILHETGAVKPVRCTAAPNIGNADVLLGGRNDL